MKLSLCNNRISKPENRISKLEIRISKPEVGNSQNRKWGIPKTGNEEKPDFPLKKIKSTQWHRLFVITRMIFFFLSYFSFFLLCAMHIDLDCLIFVQKLIRKFSQISEFLDCNLDLETHKQFITFLVFLNLTLLVFDGSLKSFFFWC